MRKTLRTAPPQSKGNYRSVAKHVEAIEAQFRDEEQEGLMEEVPEKDHAAIQKSIEAAVSSLGWLGRKIAAKRLANHKDLPQRIEISQLGNRVSIVMGKYSAVAPIDGAERELVGPNGRDSKHHYEIRQDTIVQYFVFEHAKRKSTYSFDDEGRLVMTVYMTSEKLASPIEYALVYASDRD